MYVIVSNTNSFGAKAIECYHHELDAISSGYKHDVFFQQISGAVISRTPKIQLLQRIFRGKPWKTIKASLWRSPGCWRCTVPWQPFGDCWWFNQPNVTEKQTPRDQPKYIPNTSGGLFFLSFLSKTNVGIVGIPKVSFAFRSSDSFGWIVLAWISMFYKQ